MMRAVSRLVGGGLMLALLLVPAHAAGQVTFGFSAGLSLATLGGDNVDEDLESRTGFNAGAFLDFPVADIIGLTTGLYYVQKGAEFGDENFELAIDYLEVPLLIRVAAVESETANLNFFLGPTLAFEMKCEGTFGSVTADCEDDEFATRSFDLGAAFGVGVSFPMGESMSLLATAIYDLGLRSIDDSGFDDDVKNEAVLLNVGIGFRLGR